MPKQVQHRATLLLVGAVHGIQKHGTSLVDPRTKEILGPLSVPVLVVGGQIIDRDREQLVERIPTDFGGPKQVGNAAALLAIAALQSAHQQRRGAIDTPEKEILRLPCIAGHMVVAKMIKANLE